jgi:predicted nucleic acid-binding protein
VPDTVAYCDTSVVLAAYLSDEHGHAEARRRLLSDDVALVSSAIAEVELTAALHAAARHGLLGDAQTVRAEISADARGPLLFIALDPPRVFPLAMQLCVRHRLRALDAIHLAVALTSGRELVGAVPLTFITRDADQTAAARAEGLEVE